MVLGYLFIGTIAGFVAFITAIILDKSFWTALALYSAVGALCTILLPLVQLAVGTLISLFAGRKAAPQSVIEIPGPVAETSTFATPKEAASPNAAMRILAVDDVPSILELVSIISAQAGYSSVTTAASAELALEAIANADRPFDCFLLDITMPGMDGIDLCRQIRGIQGYRETPIIMLTGISETVSLQRAFKAGATDYATKPFDIFDFCARLRTAQDLVRMRQQAAMAVSAKTERSQDLDHAIDLSEELHLDSASGLVAYEILRTYLTQLSPGELAGVEVVAVKVDQIENIHCRASSTEFTNALTKAADAIGEVFEAARPMIAYAGSGIFVTVSDGAAVPPSLDAETRIQSLLNSTGAENGDGDALQITVSMGRTIRPQAGKAQRASVAFNRAIVSAEQRELSKQGERRSRSLQLVAR